MPDLDSFYNELKHINNLHSEAKSMSEMELGNVVDLLDALGYSEDDVVKVSPREYSVGGTTRSSPEFRLILGMIEKEANYSPPRRPSRVGWGYYKEKYGQEKPTLSISSRTLELYSRDQQKMLYLDVRDGDWDDFPTQYPLTRETARTVYDYLSVLQLDKTTLDDF